MKTLAQCISDFETMKHEMRDECYRAFNDVSLEVQTKKLNQSGILDETQRREILSNLNVRPALLVHIAEQMRSESNGMKVFAEVGTAQGLQSLCFARNFQSSKVYTCDIKDDRSIFTKDKENIKFILGNSQSMRDQIPDNEKLDFCWIDGSHDSYAVIEDFISLFGKSHKDTIWAFDDFDTRFGCYNDIVLLAGHFRDSIALNLGLTASGSPNKILIAREFKSFSL